MVYSGNSGIVFNNPPGLLPAQVPPDPYWISDAGFNALVSGFGVNLFWEKSHACPCVWQGYPNSRGSPQPSCLTCFGLGWYWDAPVGPFSALLTYAHSPLAADEPGALIDERLGQIVGANPLLTLAYSPNPMIWQMAGEFDRYTEADAFWRYNTTLYAGQKTILPYTSGVSVAPSGAVTMWNPSTSAVQQVTGYVVSGIAVIASGLPLGTPYMVEFQANPQFVAIKRSGSFPHVRPFVQGTIPLPKRYRLAQADLWMRRTNSY